MGSNAIAMVLLFCSLVSLWARLTMLDRAIAEDRYLHGHGYLHLSWDIETRLTPYDKTMFLV